MVEVSKSDWKLFRSRIGAWQEFYMEKLNQKYIEILSDPEKQPSEKFWKIHDEIKTDKRHPGVVIDMRRSTMLYHLATLLADDVIGLDDLESFSTEVQNAVKLLARVSFDEE